MKKIILILPLLLLSCAQLGLGTTSHNAWVDLDNGIAVAFQDDTAPLGKDYFERIKKNLSVVYDGKKCIGQDDKEIDLNYCKSVDLIFSNTDNFFAEWNDLDIEKLKLEEDEELHPEDLNTEDTVVRGQKLKSSQQRLKLFITKYGLNQFKNDQKSEMSQLGFYIEKQILNQNVDAEIQRMDKVVAQLKVMDAKKIANDKRCATFEKNVATNTEEQLRLHDQITTSQNDKMAQAKLDQLTKLAEKLRFMIFDRNFKGCRSYKGMD